MPIRISKKETIKIAYSNGNYFINHEYKHENYAVLPTDINSGKIVYTKVVDFKGATAKDLFNSADGLLQGMVKFTSVSSDRSDFTYQKYVGCFVTKYAGDPYNIYFNLIIRFKENKIKYEFTDFLAIFSKLKSKQSLNIIDAFANGTNSVTITNAKYLDVSYARGDRTSEVKKFWQPINDNIQQSIEMIINLCSMATPEKKDKW